MRILVTNNGKQYLEILEKQKQEEMTNSLTYKEVSKDKTMSYFQSTELMKSASCKSVKHSNKLKKSRLLNMNFSTEISDNKENTQKVNSKKLRIPKSILSKYNADNKEGRILVNLPESIQNKIERSSMLMKSDFSRNGSVNHNIKLEIKDIIKEDTLKTLQNTLANEIRIKEKNTVFHDLTFRSQKNTLLEDEKLEKNIQTKIGTEQVNIIKYINSKNQISPNFIKQIVKFDEERLNKINQICQKVFENDERSKLFDKILKENIKLKKQKELIKFKNDLCQVDSWIERANQIKNDYNIQENIRLKKFGDLHSDVIKKFWSKNNQNI